MLKYGIRQVENIRYLYGISRSRVAGKTYKTCFKRRLSLRLVVLSSQTTAQGRPLHRQAFYAPAVATCQTWSCLDNWQISDGCKCTRQTHVCGLGFRMYQVDGNGKVVGLCLRLATHTEMDRQVENIMHPAAHGMGGRGIIIERTGADSS